MIGLAGSHNTGKTTLAKAYAASAGIPFVESRVSAVFKEMGLDSGTAWGSISANARMDVQDRVLAEHVRLYRDAGPSAFITDRTPIDFIAYTMADLRPNDMTPDVEERFKSYFIRCMEAIAAHFTVVVVLQPCEQIAPVEREGRGKLSPFFVGKLNQLIMGLVRDEDFKARSFYMPRRLHTLDDRVRALRNATQQVTQQHILNQAEQEEVGSTTLH